MQTQIKFISHNQIAGEVVLKNHTDVIYIEINETSPVLYQVRFDAGKLKLVRDLHHIKDNLYMCRPELTKEFIESTSLFKVRLLIITGEEVIPTNPVSLFIDSDWFEGSKQGDPINELNHRITELERVMKIFSINYKATPINIPTLGKPEPGMLYTALTEDIFGWSKIFTNFVKSINGIESIEGALSLGLEDLLYEGKDFKDVVDKIIARIIVVEKANVTLTKLLREEIKKVAALRKELNDHINRDII
jgi:hypothetical protein